MHSSGTTFYQQKDLYRKKSCFIIYYRKEIKIIIKRNCLQISYRFSFFFSFLREYFEFELINIEK